MSVLGMNGGKYTVTKLHVSDKYYQKEYLDPVAPNPAAEINQRERGEEKNN